MPKQKRFNPTCPASLRDLRDPDSKEVVKGFKLMIERGSYLGRTEIDGRDAQTWLCWGFDGAPVYVTMAKDNQGNSCFAMHSVPLVFPE